MSGSLRSNFGQSLRSRPGPASSPEGTTETVASPRCSQKGAHPPMVLRRSARYRARGVQQLPPWRYRGGRHSSRASAAPVLWSLRASGRQRWTLRPGLTSFGSHAGAPCYDEGDGHKQMNHQEQLHYPASAATEHRPYIHGSYATEADDILARTTLRAAEGSTFRANQFKTAIPRQGPPKIRR